jgi:hypothetical protein
VPKKNSPSLLPSTAVTSTRKPDVALALGPPLAPMLAWQPLAVVPGVH